MSKQVVFFGSSPFSVIVLNKLIEKGVSVPLVVTASDKPFGRGQKLTPNPVKSQAMAHKITVVENLAQVSENMSQLLPKNEIVGLIAAYGKIIPQSLIDLFSGLVYNIHPSLLPAYRGPSPLQQQILDGLEKTGVTVIQLDSEMDHGPIIASSANKMLSSDTTTSLGERLFLQGTNDFIDNVVLIDNPNPTMQDHSQATYTHKFAKEDGFIEIEKLKREIKSGDRDLDRKLRAFTPWPGVWTTKDNVRIKLIDLHPVTLQKSGETPTIDPGLKLLN